MINGKRVAVVMPAYNAEKTLEKTVRELPEIVDVKILVDDSSTDNTAALAASWASWKGSTRGRRRAWQKF